MARAAPPNLPLTTTPRRINHDGPREGPRDLVDPSCAMVRPSTVPVAGDDDQSDYQLSTRGSARKVPGRDQPNHLVLVSAGPSAATIIALPTACRATTTADRGVVRYLAVPPW